MEAKKTIVLGASVNPSRYSNMAVKKLLNYGHEVVPVGIKKGEIDGIEILAAEGLIDDVDTVALYLGPQNQAQYYDYIKSQNPKRVIFNPGTINQEFMGQLEKDGVEVVDACTLVMLSANTY
ncbi:MAG: putative CoA-binding protein [Vicingaceae bacterium]|jgi:predicted CoA-binding protein